MWRTGRCLSFAFLAVFLLTIGSSPSRSATSPASATSLGQSLPSPQEITGAWVSVGSLTDGRHDHSATLLQDGRILIVGGLQERVVGSMGLASAETYDPATGTWDATGSLNIGRTDHTATLLLDGRVLVTGGMDGYSGSTLASAEVYDPVSGIWSLVAPLSVPRRGHTATRLADGRVLVAGGRYSTFGPDVHASVEIYDPVTASWGSTGLLTTPREGHSATLLPDGRVIVVNGYYLGWLASAEVYDVATETWEQIPNPIFCHGVAHTATLMSDGNVLVVGGACGSGTDGIRAEAEVYDPIAATWSIVGALPKPREAHTATKLPDGLVLVVGGDNGDLPRYDSALIYEPSRGVWIPTQSLVTGRRNHTATLLADGTVLVVGGWGNDSTSLASAERFLRFRVLLPITLRNTDQ